MKPCLEAFAQGGFNSTVCWAMWPWGSCSSLLHGAGSQIPLQTPPSLGPLADIQVPKWARGNSFALTRLERDGSCWLGRGQIICHQGCLSLSHRQWQEMLMLFKSKNFGNDKFGSWTSNRMEAETNRSGWKGFRCRGQCPGLWQGIVAFCRAAAQGGDCVLSLGTSPKSCVFLACCWLADSQNTSVYDLNWLTVQRLPQTSSFPVFSQK